MRLFEMKPTTKTLLRLVEGMVVEFGIEYNELKGILEKIF